MGTLHVEFGYITYALRCFYIYIELSVEVAYHRKQISPS